MNTVGNVTVFTPVAGLIGGVLIGLAAVLLMGARGRLAGLSGIVGGLLTARFNDEFGWRAIFVVGLLAGAALTAGAGYFDPASLAFSGGPLLTVAGGLIVGFGAILGGGCTSGHGICGMSRLSVRSLVSTCVFMAVAIVTVFIVRHVMGG